MKTRKRIVITSAVALIWSAGLALGQTQEDRSATRERPGAGEETAIYESRELEGLRVEGSDGERLGTVESLAVDLQTGEVGFVVVETGGVLGIGADLKVVPIEVIEVARRDRLVGEGKIVRVAIEEARWREIPAYEAADIARLCEEAEARRIYELYGLNWEERRTLRALFEDVGETAAELARRGQEAITGERRDQRVEERTTVRECELVLTSALHRRVIHGVDDERIGDMDNLVVDLVSGRVHYLLVAPETRLFRRPARIYALPARSLQTFTEERVVVNITREQIEQAEVLTETTVQQHVREDVRVREEEPRVFVYEREAIVFGRPER